ncbi:unnamed protein product, partial [Didymodactylos carnosus]
YLKSENLPETMTRNTLYRELCHSNEDENVFFSPKSNRSLFGAFQDLKQSTQKLFENRKIYDDVKLALACSLNTDSSNTNEVNSVNNNSHLILVDYKNTSTKMELSEKNSTINTIPVFNCAVSLIQQIKDTPLKLAIDGRRNLVALWSTNRKFSTFIHSPDETTTTNSNRMEDDTWVTSGTTTTLMNTTNRSQMTFSQESTKTNI